MVKTGADFEKLKECGNRQKSHIEDTINCLEKSFPYGYESFVLLLTVGTVISSSFYNILFLLQKMLTVGGNNKLNYLSPTIFE